MAALGSAVLPCQLRGPVAWKANAKATRARATAVNTTTRAVVYEPASPDSKLLMPTGKYCESHFQTIRRPTRCIPPQAPRPPEPPSPSPCHVFGYLAPLLPTPPAEEVRSSEWPPRQASRSVVAPWTRLGIGRIPCGIGIRRAPSIPAGVVFCSGASGWLTRVWSSGKKKAGTDRYVSPSPRCGAQDDQRGRSAAGQRPPHRAADHDHLRHPRRRQDRRRGTREAPTPQCQHFS